MTKDVVQISANKSMAEAAMDLVKYEVSSVPVVDERGNCVGILSSADFVQKESSLAHVARSTLDMEHQFAWSQHEQPLPIERVTEDLVSHYMSPAVQTIRKDALLIEAAKIMCLQHIHRLPVFDDKGHLVGVLSSMDVVAVLVNVFEEQSSQR